MLPTIPPGARLRVVPLVGADPLPGQIYVFEHRGGVRAHRFLGVGADGLGFRGDNAPGAEVVDPEALIGRVDAVVLLGRPFALDAAPMRGAASVLRVGLFVVRRVVPDRWRDRLGGALRRRLE